MPDSTPISNIRGYAAETHHGQEHVDRWHRVLKTLGAEEFPGLTTMTSGEAQGYADMGWDRWIPVVAELKIFEAWQKQQEQEQQEPQQQDGFTADPTLIATIKMYAAETWKSTDHVDRWNRVLAAFGVLDHSSPMTATEAQTYVDMGWDRWIPVLAELKALEATQ